MADESMSLSEAIRLADDIDGESELSVAELCAIGVLSTLAKRILDPAQIDDAAVEVMASARRRELGLQPFAAIGGVEQTFEKGAMRAALAALLAHLAEVE